MDLRRSLRRAASQPGGANGSNSQDPAARGEPDMKRWRLWLSVALLTAAAAAVGARRPCAAAAQLVELSPAAAAAAREHARALGQSAAGPPAGAGARCLALDVDVAGAAQQRARSLPGLAAPAARPARAHSTALAAVSALVAASSGRRSARTSTQFARLPPGERMQLRQRWLNATPGAAPVDAADRHAPAAPACERPGSGMRRTAAAHFAPAAAARYPHGPR